MIEVLAPYHSQLEIIQLKDEEVDDCENCENCEECSRYNKESDDDCSDDNNPLTDSSISTPSVVPEVELENPENYSDHGNESDESIVVLDTTVNYFKKAQAIVNSLKDEIEKKND